jgi:hypothetical protein
MAERSQNLIGGAGKKKGRFRETRVGRFEANMGAGEASVKSPDVERLPNGTA